MDIPNTFFGTHKDEWDHSLEQEIDFILYYASKYKAKKGNDVLQACEQGYIVKHNHHVLDDSLSLSHGGPGLSVPKLKED